MPARIRYASPVILLALAACVNDAPPPAAPDGAVARGRVVAERVCSLCHQVAPDRPSAREAAAPSFMEIANLPGHSRDYLRRYASERHVVETVGEPKPVMPVVFLSPEDREDVVLYILSYQRPDAPVDQPPKKAEPFE
ncbi:MAG: hypothetical protein JNK67_10210 [Alphaproteobacteria bacterium]|nr:hypothetical protein [Alphaproteobacteria bacterium]